MANSDRRRFLTGVLGSLAAAAGTVVLASTATAESPAGETVTGPQPEQPGDIQARAEQIANASGVAEEKGPVGGFRNSGFLNSGGGGGFRNSAFRNY